MMKATNRLAIRSRNLPHSDAVILLDLVECYESLEEDYRFCLAKLQELTSSKSNNLKFLLEKLIKERIDGSQV